MFEYNKINNLTEAGRLMICLAFDNSVYVYVKLVILEGDFVCKAKEGVV